MFAGRVGCVWQISNFQAGFQQHSNATTLPTTPSAMMEAKTSHCYVNNYMAVIWPEPCFREHSPIKSILLNKVMNFLCFSSLPRDLTLSEPICKDLKYCEGHALDGSSMVSVPPRVYPDVGHRGQQQQGWHSHKVQGWELLVHYI